MVVSMPMNHVSVAEEALSLSPEDRAALARLLIESLEGDGRTAAEIKAELAKREADKNGNREADKAAVATAAPGMP